MPKCKCILMMLLYISHLSIHLQMCYGDYHDTLLVQPFNLCIIRRLVIYQPFALLYKKIKKLCETCLRLFEVFFCQKPISKSATIFCSMYCIPIRMWVTFFPFFLSMTATRNFTKEHISIGHRERIWYRHTRQKSQIKFLMKTQQHSITPASALHICHADLRSNS